MAEVTYGGIAPMPAVPELVWGASNPSGVASPFGTSLRANAQFPADLALESNPRGGGTSGREGVANPAPQSIGLGSALPPGVSGAPSVLQHSAPTPASTGAPQDSPLAQALRAAHQAITAANGGGVQGPQTNITPANTPAPQTSTTPTATPYTTPNYWMGGNEIGQNIDPYNPNSQWKPAGSADQKFVQWANPAGVSAAQAMLTGAGVANTVNPTNTEFDPFGTTKQAQLNTGAGGPLMNAGLVAALMNNPYYRDNPQLLKERLQAEANPNALGRPGESVQQTQQRLAQPTQPAATPAAQTATSPLAALLRASQPQTTTPRATQQSNTAPSWMSAWNRIRRPIGYTSWNRAVQPTGAATPAKPTQTGQAGTNNQLMNLLSLLLGQ